MKSNKIEYDAEYKIGNTKVYVVSPENPVRLGRKMTQEEIDAILERVTEQASKMARSIMLKELKKDEKEANY
ncbi:hypothetical protein Q604_UNBC07301G0015 [human gut metagenome]|jgi:hypothetical protein|uniref:Uncharacterized protein n=2 Tax=root TaxID=1 RepID=R5X8T1_9FIRM|nr:hypothetical protein [Intestinibacter bartlettii]MDU1252898.1 hypothetical protein [Peptostreptococcaceae bacterium]MDU6199652.1 hypothetical protein [Intestinibacter bartlettii]CDA11225.1 unknown [Intestinibacter bartlettii CAG:1329]SCI39900.1 Uncharacterised protein [uncultured Clostridium sp.]